MENGGYKHKVLLLPCVLLPTWQDKLVASFLFFMFAFYHNGSLKIMTFIFTIIYLDFIICVRVYRAMARCVVRVP